MRLEVKGHAAFTLLGWPKGIHDDYLLRPWNVSVINIDSLKIKGPVTRHSQYTECKDEFRDPEMTKFHFCSLTSNAPFVSVFNGSQADGLLAFLLLIVSIRF